MEKEIDRKTVVLQEDENVGSVKIADDVVATIARLAANEVEGGYYIADTSFAFCALGEPTLIIAKEVFT